MKRALFVLLALTALTFAGNSTAKADRYYHRHHHPSFHSHYSGYRYGGGCNTYRPFYSYGGPSYFEHRTYYSTRPSIGYSYGYPGIGYSGFGYSGFGYPGIGYSGFGYGTRSPRVGVYIGF